MSADDDGDGCWGLLLVGDFGSRSERYYALARDEAKARERALWWRSYRPDVQVTVVVRDGPGGVWRFAEEGVQV